MFRTALVRSSKGTVSSAEAEQLAREVDHYTGYIMSGAANKIRKVVEHKYGYYLAPRACFGVLGDLLIATGR